jgi:hypothetical protein
VTLANPVSWEPYVQVARSHQRQDYTTPRRPGGRLKPALQGVAE